MKQINANKPHVAIFGKCNSGKSTLMNFLSTENLSIVSPEIGTTTDYVKRSLEIEGFAPIVVYDTAGLDDNSQLAQKRVAKSYEVLELIDLAIVLTSHNHITESEMTFIDTIIKKGISPLILHNNFEGNALTERFKNQIKERYALSVFDFSPLNNLDRDNIFSLIKTHLPLWSYTNVSMIPQSVKKGDIVLLITPIDVSAPSGRLILPQVQAIRNLLDINAIVITVQLSEIENILNLNIKPRLVITDSQVIKEVTQILRYTNIEITTFSILLASSKGDMESYKEGLKAVDNLKDGDKILIIENCLHQVSCEDIGRIKIPNWLENHCGIKLNFKFVNGLNPLPEDLESYKLAVQCGGCMVTRRQLHARISRVKGAGVAITNYGMLIKKIRC